jgi:ABC-type amino acid transport system permease subunit
VLCIAGAMYYVMSWGMAALGRRVEQGWQEHD